MTPHSNPPAFRFSKLLRDAMRGEKISPGSPLRIARAVDADILKGRFEGRARKVSGGAPKASLSAGLQSRIGSSRSVARKLGKRGSFQFDPRQRAVVKAHYFSHGGGGAKALREHARYIARDAAGKEPGREADSEPEGAATEAEKQAQAHARYLQRQADRTVFYDAAAQGVDGQARATDWAREDRRHFRLILSTENGAKLNELQSFTREVMRRAELALNTRLEWVAVDHWDTANPHTHIILRGKREDGRDLVIPRDYISHGFRNAARDLATERLGERTREDGRLALQREAQAHRVTSLDRMIENQLDDKGRIRVARLQAPNRSPDLTNALKARAHELRRLGLATEVRRNLFALQPGWRDGLKAMEMHLDIRKALIRARSQDLARSIENARQITKNLRLPPGLGR